MDTPEGSSSFTISPLAEILLTGHSLPFNPLMPSGAFNICCPRDAVSRTANVERTVRH